jgi:hypothetical protein
MNGDWRARADVSGDGAMQTVFQVVRQTCMLTSSSGGFSLVFLRTVPLLLDLRLCGILGRGALGHPTLSPRIGKRCHHGHRPHESKKHHCRR